MSDRPVGKPRAMPLAAGAVVIGLALSAWTWSSDPSQLLAGYLTAWLAALEVVLGVHVLRWLNNLTGGAWGVPVRRIAPAARALLPLLAVAFMPIALSLAELYPWAAPEAASDKLLQHKRPWLNPDGFQIRAIVYFAIWTLADLWIVRLERIARESPSEDTERRLRIRSAQALLLYGLSMTFASVDWAMSLEPHWYSAAYGVIVVIGQGLGALAFTTLATAVIQAAREVSHDHDAHHHEEHEHHQEDGHGKPPVLQDLGNLLLAFTMLFTYVSFSQFLIIWFGDLPEEVVWYVRRIEHGWQWVAGALALLHFGAPFATLLSRRAKRTPQIVGAIAAGLLFMRWVDTVWKVGPARDGGAALTFAMYLGPALLVGGLVGGALAMLIARDVRADESLQR